MGQSASERFAEAGASVYLLDIDWEKGEAAAAAIRAKGGVAEFVACDVTSSASVDDAFAHVLSGVEGIDILVNNAGGWTKQQSVSETPEEEWDRIIDLNLKSVYLCARAAVPSIRRKKGGRIINMGSIAGLTATHTNSSPPYMAAKAGIHQLTRLLAAELGGEGVTVNAIAPGTTATERVAVARIGASTMAGRIGEVEDIVGWILFLASSEAGYLMGQTVAVNGGRLMV